MSALQLLALLVFGSALVRSHDELKTEVTFKPESCDRLSKNGDMLIVHYTGYLAKDKTKFDSSYDRPHPFNFQIGAGQVIKGWDQGLLNMCKGEKRELTVPASLGYGDRGAGNLIPGGATLFFETELVDIQDAPPAVNVFKQIDADADQKLSKVEIFKFIQQQMEKNPEAKRPDEETDKIVNEIFSNEDSDQDGFISHEEFRGPKHDEL